MLGIPISADMFVPNNFILLTIILFYSYCIYFLRSKILIIDLFFFSTQPMNKEYFLFAFEQVANRYFLYKLYRV